MPSIWTRSFGGHSYEGRAAARGLTADATDPQALVFGAVADGVRPIADYADREGYDPQFHGETLPLPGAGRWADDVLPLVEAAQIAGKDPAELKYTHFSTKQSASRRQPLFSAVNISGEATQRDVPRTNVWRKDPRIPLDRQVIRECYGAEQQGLFSRGHQTRREDPNWGGMATAKQADADTFHVTNACPQQQGFNGGIWLALENYVLDNVDREDMRVTVVTGPVFADTDPTYRGVKVPVEFWKIVVFPHPELGKLAAIGYKRSQASSLPRTAAFVFGDFEDTQVPIAGLQEQTGLDLSAYARLDVMADADRYMAVRLRTLSDLWLTP